MASRIDLTLSLTPELHELLAAELRSDRHGGAEDVLAAGLALMRAASLTPAPDEASCAAPGQAPGGPPSPSELRYRAILESAVDYAIIAFDGDQRIIEWNAGARAITGWTEAEMLGRDGALIFTPEDRAAGIPDKEMRRATEEGRAVNERWHMRADGGRFWGSGLMMPVRDAAGTTVGHVKVMQDRTVQHRLGRDLEDSEARLRAVFAAVPVGILIAEAPSGRLVEANAQLDRLFGPYWPRSSELTDYAAWECFHPDGRRLAAAEYPLARALNGEEAPVAEVLRRADDDARHWVRIKGAPIRDAAGAITGAVVAVEDIDEARRAAEVLRRDNDALTGAAADAAADLGNSRRALEGSESLRNAAEGQVRQLQKMEAVGQLTGGLAHDFNNMLSVVVSGLSLTKRRLARGDADVGRFIDAAMDGAQRAATLTQRLLAFSRQQALAPVVLDVNAMVHGMEDLLRRTLGEAIELEMVLAGGLWRTHADSSQLENALLNLAVNARDAMGAAGRLTVETANGHLDDAYARQHEEVAAGQYVLLAVTDVGTGMPPEVIARAFEPFYTTKPPGSGTGLGLSQVYGFVKQSAGHLKIYSEPGQGTTVKMYLPRFTGQDGAAAAAPPPAAMVPGGADELILVVEDEERVRMLAVAALRDLGYGVIHADGAAEALRQLDAHPAVSLMFTDIVMPGTNGRLLADEVLRRRPGMPVLFTTGYTRNAVVHNGVLDAGVDLLGKPYSVEQLSTKLREMLDRPRIAESR